MSTEEIVKKLLDQIQNATDGFNSSIPEIQKEIFKRVQLLLKDIKTSGDNVQSSVSNIKSINRLKSEIDDAILNPDYLNSVADFTDAFAIVSNLQDQYFTSLYSQYETPKLVDALKTQAIEETVTSLTESGISGNVTEGIQAILKANVIGKASYSDLVEQMRTFILTDEKGLGALEKYTQQITVDALNQYSRQYNQLVTSDLDLKWHQYVGSTRKTTRPFCRYLVEKRYIHESELQEILDGHIDGHTVPINDSGVWAGGIPGTTVDNFATNAGGYRCGHQYLGVSETDVPKDIRLRLYKKIGDKKKVAELEG